MNKTILALVLTTFCITSASGAYEGLFERKRTYLTYDEDSPAVHHFDDLTFAGSFTGFAQGSNGAKDITGWDDKGTLNHTMNFEVRSHIREGDSIFFRFQSAEGNGLSSTTLFPFSNTNGMTISNTANRSTSAARLRTVEAYWEKEAYYNNVIFTLGKLDPTQYFDQNRFANDAEKQFVNSIFCNASTIEFPDYTAGTRLSWHPSNVFEMTYGLFETTSSYTLNTLGLATTEWDDQGDGTFHGLQLNFKPHWYRWHDYQGHYRVYGWTNTYKHRRIDDASARLSNRGFGISFDQQFGERWGGFLRASWQDTRINTVDRNWSLGAHFTGNTWYSRPITAGIGIGQNLLGDDAEKNAPYTGNDTAPETHFEVWARVPVTERMSFTPDIQVVTKPQGYEQNDTVTLFGLRGRITF